MIAGCWAQWGPQDSNAYARVLRLAYALCAIACAHVRDRECGPRRVVVLHYAEALSNLVKFDGVPGQGLQTFWVHKFVFSFLLARSLSCLGAGL